MSPDHQVKSNNPVKNKNQERFSIMDLYFVFSSFEMSGLLVINETPIPAKMIKIDVEFPVNKLKNLLITSSVG